jgi:hypothetical protein
MARFTPKVVTANDLRAGDVIYRRADGSWSRRHGDAALFTEPELAEAALKAAERETGAVVGAYLADAAPSPDGPVPTHFREVFRTRGPSNYPHGKQAELSDV